MISFPSEGESKYFFTYRREVEPRVDARVELRG